MKFIKFGLVLIGACLLTVGTQIGGILFLICYFVYTKSSGKHLLSFFVLYLLATFVMIPLLAPSFGREPIKTSESVKIYMFLTQLANRNYVVPQINSTLEEVSANLRKEYPHTVIHCLDANFPFWDGFPLAPHLSHNDGKKLDISLLYEDQEGKVVNHKPSRSGYGIFEHPTSQEYDQIEVCKNKGYWQYDFSKYLSLGTTHENLRMSTSATKRLVVEILKRKEISKVFIEPHLRQRMSVTHPKLRYHGCKAVRHDDHIHLQVK